MTDKLRRQAEELVQANNFAQAPPLSLDEMQKTLHELHVHQIELELQNEELRCSHADLDAARARYFDLYDMAPVGYCTISSQGLITEANLTAATLLGVARGDIIGRPWSRFIFKDDQDIFYQERKILYNTMSREFDLRMMKKSGADFWVHLSATVVPDSENVPVCRIVMNDISERKREEQFRENVERIINHDIKGPLVNLYSLAQMIVEGDVSESTVEFFPQIMVGIRQVIYLIDAAEPLRKMERGEYAPPKSPVEIHQLLHTIKQTLWDLALMNKVVIDLQEPTTFFSVRPQLYGEAFLLESMFMNLVKNAVEASPEGGHVTIEYFTRGSATHIAIHNQGSIPESIRDKFFEKDVTSGKICGTGLGTYSAQLIAKGHKGSIAFTTSETTGTTVTVTLPCC